MDVQGFPSFNQHICLGEHKKATRYGSVERSVGWIYAHQETEASLISFQVLIL